MRTIGVLGVGTIGTGVVQNLSQAGFRVIAVDRSEEALARGAQLIQQNVRMYRLFGGTAAAVPDEQVMENITFTTDETLLSDASYIIENITEDWNLKKEVYTRLDLICPDPVIFAVNTSCIPITKAASATQRPTKVIGLHFMNPVPLKPVAEVIRGYHTSPETLEITKGLLSQMGKEGIVVNDMPGFVSNRLMTLMINEAAFLVQERVAGVNEIDRLIKLSYGHKMGPLETCDLIGVDTILHSMEVMYECFKDSKFRPCPILYKMVDAGCLGRKSGQGFYNYSKELILQEA